MWVCASVCLSVCVRVCSMYFDFDDLEFVVVLVFIYLLKKKFRVCSMYFDFGDLEFVVVQG